jgi:hypothetical protein
MRYIQPQNVYRSLVRKPIFYPAVVAAGVVLVAYLCTLAPSLFALDSPELTTAAYTLGLVHSPGYPVYLILVHVFQYLPIGDIAYRSNLFSAVANTGTVFLLTLLIQQMGVRTLPALTAGLSFGFCYYVWFVSVITEVYTLQGLFLAGMLLFLWHWRTAGQPHALFLAVGIAGLAAANNPATSLWWPGLGLLALTTSYRRHLTLRHGVYLVGIGVLSLTPILYLPWRSAAHPAFVYIGHYDVTGTFQAVDLTKLHTLIWYITGGQFRHLAFAYTPHEILQESVRVLTWLWAAFLGIGIPLGLWGFWTLWRHTRLGAIGLLGTALPHGAFYIAYRVPDKEMMLLPVFLVWAVLIGIGLNQATHVLPQRLVPGILMLPLSLLLVNGPLVNVNDMWMLHNTAHARLQAAAPNAMYLAPWGDAAAMQYHQIVLQTRSDVAAINILLTAPETLPLLVDEALTAERPIYITYQDARLVRAYNMLPVPYGYKITAKRGTP